MNILFLSTWRLENYGGGEKWLIEIGNELTSRGYNVKVVCGSYLEKKRKSYNDILKEIKFEYKIEYIPKVLKLGFINFDKVDVIYLMNFTNFVLQPLIRRSKRVIIGNHGFSVDSILKYKTLRYILHLIKYLWKTLPEDYLYFHTINSLQEKIYKRYNFKNVYFVQNFVNTEEYYYPQKSDKFIVLFLARFDKQKGLDILPYIIKKVLERNKDIIFWICGSGREEYERAIKELEREYPNNVKYFGFVSEDEKKLLLSQASLFLAPSIAEASPLAVREALVSGCPFLGSNIISFRDIINLDHKFGWIVKEYTPKAFSSKILDIYEFWKENTEEYYKLRKEISKKARELFDLKKVVDKFENIFLKI